jgi:undecaprenyl-diphosphatase
MIESLSAIDKALFLYLHSFRAEWLNSVMIFLSGQALWIPMIGIMLFLGWKKFDRYHFWIFLIFLILTLIATDVTSSYITKNIFQRFRPCRMEDLKSFIYQFGQKCGGRFGFVSSHAANSLALIMFMKNLELKSKWFILLLVLPLLISFSRIYLGSHYPGDILGGMLVGVFWSYTFSLLLKWTFQGAKRNNSQD